jgi:predicted 3-demethylubiquinone-9 3-methyltransferase (glyoxalase superfamily)
MNVLPFFKGYEKKTKWWVQVTSFVINCTTQDEADEFWKRLSEGGEQQPCGWLKDRFGVS